MRKFELVEPGDRVVGRFEISCPEDELPDTYASLVKAADTSTTFTFEQGGHRWLSVGVREVKDEIQA
jgi:hypothetical protein